MKNKLDMLIKIELAISLLYDGIRCEVCNFIQGTEHKGVKKSYCKHITKEIDKALEPISKRLTNKIMADSNEFN